MLKDSTITTKITHLFQFTKANRFNAVGKHQLPCQKKHEIQIGNLRGKNLALFNVKLDIVLRRFNFRAQIRWLSQARLVEISHLKT
jgi:hypothetical protein